MRAGTSRAARSRRLLGLQLDRRGHPVGELRRARRASERHDERLRGAGIRRRDLDLFTERLGEVLQLRVLQPGLLDERPLGEPVGPALHEGAQGESSHTFEDDARPLGSDEPFAETRPRPHGVQVRDPRIFLGGIALQRNAEVVASGKRTDQVERLPPAHGQRGNASRKENTVSLRQQRERRIGGILWLCAHDGGKGKSKVRLVKEKERPGSVRLSMTVEPARPSRKAETHAELRSHRRHCRAAADEEAEGRRPLDLIARVAREAMADAGLAPSDVDGIVVCPAMMQYSMLWPSVVAEHLGLAPSYLEFVDLGERPPAR